jgi:hypothetical protein
VKKQSDKKTEKKSCSNCCHGKEDEYYPAKIYCNRFPMVFEKRKNNSCGEWKKE